jgi:hypothetical protein
MRIRSKDLPQADRIESVVQTCVAVFNGARTDIEIANAIPSIAGDDRQGRYYRAAAQLLGFITNARNVASITPLGRQIALNPNLTNPTLISAVLSLNIYQNLFPYFQIHPEGVTREQVQTYLQSISVENLGLPMINRRMASILSWLRVLGIIDFNHDRFSISNQIIPQLPIINLTDIQQPILPRTGSLTEYMAVETRTNAAKGMITIYKDEAKLERSNTAHKMLINLVAERIVQVGGIAKCNSIIDLATSLDHDFIFEMKSTTEGNAKAQIRKGISQLYEYRYLQNSTDAELVLVVENPLQPENNWLLDYLEQDRDICLVWDGNNSLYGSEVCRNRLPFLNLQAV